jgi:hypothetical protein
MPSRSVGSLILSQQSRWWNGCLIPVNNLMQVSVRLVRSMMKVADRFGSLRSTPLDHRRERGPWGGVGGKSQPEASGERS